MTQVAELLHGGEEHVFGVTPNYEHLNWTGLDFSRAQFDQVTRIDAAEWKAEMALHAELFNQLSYHLPEALKKTKAKKWYNFFNSKKFNQKE